MTKYWQLLKPAGVGGVVTKKPRLRKQDRRAKPGEMYAVIFFPRISSLGPAGIHFFEISGTLAQSPEAARIRFMDRIKQGESWESYHKAGHRIRRVRITDLGDAPRQGSKPKGDAP